MKTCAKFEIEAITQISNQGFLVMAKRRDESEFWINEHTTLNGVPISHGDIPRAIGEDGKQRLDIWGFYLRNEQDHDLFHVGQVVLLESEPRAV